MNPRIQQAISESIIIKQQVLNNEPLLDTLARVSDICTIALKAKKKLLFCGNGGSASDAQHLAAEFSGRFYIDRAPLDAEALHVNPSYLTAAANDYSFDEVYARALGAKGREGDVLFGLSTSGKSKNVIRAFEEAKRLQILTVAMTGASGGQLHRLADFWLPIPSVDTPRIQEAHMLLGHIICELVEASIFGHQSTPS
ncbi:MAG: SIS domain-containing protein [Bacteroidota bacterium]